MTASKKIIAMSKNPIAVSNDKLADILLKEYDIRSCEILVHLQDFHRQVTFVQIYTSIVTAVSGAMLTDDAQKITAKISLQGAYRNTLCLLLLLLVAVVGFYLVSVVMDRWHAIVLNGISKMSLETRINELCGERILNWESRISPKFNSLTYIGNRFWVTPHALIKIWVVLIFIISNTLLCCLCAYVSW